MSTPVTTDIVVDALTQSITDWRERTIDAIWQIGPAGLVSPGAQAAAWLSFGLSAVNQVFPQHSPAWLLRSPLGRVAGVALKRVALPVWVFSEVQRRFNEHYQAQVRSANRALFQAYRPIQFEFIRQVQAIARGFEDSAYGRMCARVLERHYKGRKFEDKREAVHDVCALLVDAGLVDTNPASIHDQVVAGFGVIAERVGKIFAGSPAAPGENALRYAARADLYWRRSLDGVAYTTQEFQTVRRQEEALWLMAQAHAMDVWRDERRFLRNGMRHVPTTYVVCRYPNRHYRDYLPSFEAAEAEMAQALRAAEQLRTAA